MSQPEFEEPFVNSAELAARPRTIVAIYGGPTWAVLDTYEEVLAKLSGTEGDDRIELQAHQDGMAPTRILVNPHLIATVFEVTEERYRSDLAERKAKEAAMREAAARGGGLSIPPGLV